MLRAIGLTSAAIVMVIGTWHVATMRPLLKFVPHLKMSDTVTPSLQALVLWSVALVCLTVRPVCGRYTPLLATLMLGAFATAWLAHDVLIALYVSGGDQNVLDDLQHVYSCSVLIPNIDQWRQQVSFYMLGSMSVLLAYLKLVDVGAFTEKFTKYDVVARRIPAYADLFPYVELLLGLGLLRKTSNLLWPAAALFGVTTLGVAQAVLGKDHLKCGCVGAVDLPLGYVSLLESSAMTAMAVTAALQSQPDKRATVKRATSAMPAPPMRPTGPVDGGAVDPQLATPY